MLAQDGTFVDILYHRADCQPDSLAYTFLESGELESESLTYFALDRKARAIAAVLQSRCAFGERALLIYPPGLDFVAAFFGCLYAGVVAVPAYPPRQNQRLTRLQAIVTDSQAAIALTTSSLLTILRESQELGIATLQCFATDNLDLSQAEAWIQPDLSQDTLAFLQYTSGSTGTPKGVMVSHGNLVYNSAIICHHFGHTQHTHGVIWLPPYHDMGLIGGILQATFVGFSVTLMDPVSFLQKPLRWLQAISRYKGTTSGGPNFAYDLCVQKITPEQLKELDLSHWQVAFTGAEPVRVKTLKQFAAKFEHCGFRWEAFYPCYGMAETTLIISGGNPAAAPQFCAVEKNSLAEDRVVQGDPDSETTQTIVGCGKAWTEEQVVIVDPNSRTPCPEDRVGEVWVSGKSVAQGYWNQPDLTRLCFESYLAGGQSVPFLRTGDLGFIQDGELFITGRLKDVIIICGYNYYPQDIERTVEQCHPALRSNAGAAFGIEIEQQERLVIVQEVERSYLRQLDVEEIARSVQQSVWEHHGLQVYSLLLLKTASIPKTSSGKIQRHACRQGFLAATLNEIARWRVGGGTLPKALVAVADQELPHQDKEQPSKEQTPAAHNTTFLNSPEKAAIQDWLITQVAEVTGLARHTIDPDRSLGEYGLSSVQAIGLSGDLETWLGRSVPPTVVYEYPTIARLSAFLSNKQTALQFSQHGMPDAHDKGGEAIALVGLGCRFPGASNPEAFWELLEQGRDAITEVSASRWDIDRFYSETPGTPGKMNTRWGGFLEGIEQFDAQFFGISPREAHAMDPQQRLLMEVCWEALEQAGIPPKSLAGTSTGVFIGISTSDYAWLTPSWEAINAYGGTGNALSIAANRLSYALDLHGPSLAIDTACSSSLVAIHQACQSLRSRECTLAIVGGVNLILTPHSTLTFAQSKMMAADGRCKTFDASADGYVRGEGCGVTILKRLSDAIRDQDAILAVIRGSAINQDGCSHGLTAPNGLAQQSVIQQALHNAGVKPADISYVEAHGTGTPLGDPIEISALKAVLTQGRQSDQPCWIGSVKTNIGHLESAAGMAGLIKTVLALQKGKIPPLLHLKQLNPYLKLAETSLEIPTTLQPWTGGDARFAGVSSFGFGGTNAHVILQGAPVADLEEYSSADRGRPYHLLALSARTQTALHALVLKHYHSLENQPTLQSDVVGDAADFCFSVNTSRDHYEHRLAMMVDDFGQIRERLGDYIEINELIEHSIQYSTK
ncbi:MAG: AMP-binding protein [Acaryochloris sp. CRU_2_0]|nr:AMP-binding protein [Acaryochloris sp. CRU_2_0]